MWLSHSKLSVPTHLLYGKNYILLTGPQLDDVCKWVRELRTKFMSIGPMIFQETEGICEVSRSSAASSKDVENKKVQYLFFSLLLHFPLYFLVILICG